MMCAKSLRKDLRFSSIDSFLSNAMIGAGETFFPAFALALGASQVTTAMVTALPFLIGSSVQLAAPYLLERIGSYRRWMVLLGMIQALCFFPLIGMALWGPGVPITWVFAIVTLYWACGLSSGPAWNSWMATLLPSKMRPKYLARRNHLGQLGLVIGLVAGGCLLHFSKQAGYEHAAFAVLFLISGAARIGSSFSMHKQSERPGSVRAQRRLSLKCVAKKVRGGGEAHLFYFLLILSAAVNISSPFFNPFMLKQLSLSYAGYMGLIGMSFVAKIAAFSFLSKAAHNIDPFKLMRVGLVGVAIAPALWIFSGDYTFLLFAQIVSGIVWAVYELGMTLVLFGVVKDEERTSVLSVFNFLTALMVLLGTTIGGRILSDLGESSSTYFLLFGLSSAARLLTMILFDRAAESIAIERARESRERIVPYVRPEEIAAQDAQPVAARRPAEERLGSVG